MIEHMSQNITKTLKKAPLPAVQRGENKSLQNTKDRGSCRLPKAAVGFPCDVQAVGRVRLRDLARIV